MFITEKKLNEKVLEITNVLGNDYKTSIALLENRIINDLKLIVDSGKNLEKTIDNIVSIINSFDGRISTVEDSITEEIYKNHTIKKEKKKKPVKKGGKRL